MSEQVTEAEVAALVLAATRAVHERSYLSEPDVRALAPVQAILTGSDGVRLRCVQQILERFVEQRPAYRDVQLVSLIARKRLAPTVEQVEHWLAALLANTPGSESWFHQKMLSVLSHQVVHIYTDASDAGKERLRPLIKRAADHASESGAATRLRKAISEDGTIPVELLDDSDDVGRRARAVFVESTEPLQARQAALDLLASFPDAGKPSKKWLASAERVQRLLSAPGKLVGQLLDAAIDAGDTVRKYSSSEYTRYVEGGNESFLCGLAMLAGLVADPALLPQLRRLAVKCVTVIGGQFGSPRSLRAANACAKAIADTGAPASITELLALERAVRHGTLLKQIRKAIDALADAQGVTRDELLERAVETHDLNADGTRRVALSHGSALIEVEERAASLVFIDQQGKHRKAFPSEVKVADAEVLAELRASLKAIRKTIAGERHRLDGLMVLDRRWPVAQWSELYLDHPVTGRLARTLIWGVHSPTGADVVGIPQDTSTVVTSAGAEVAIPPDAEVRLWHPVHATAEHVRAWRQHLLDEQAQQPFKQAFRELYVLTPAERETRVYSNRFAGHVFGQVQARALLKGRGWQPVAVAWFDDGIDHGVARRSYESLGVRAEFFYDPIYDIEPTTSDLYPYCTSDQVRFFRIGDDTPLELADVPLLTFTEAMRDVDLVIGVTSVGADPQWLDRGEGRLFETYWHAYSFGDLNATGEVRREVLAGLVPLLAIAERCELQERFLKVRGDLRTYRIHLGSGNILMAPNDQYLCIVAARDSRAGKLFLPFDDDPVLSMILSKAFLLADDTAITDESITRQIKRG